MISALSPHTIRYIHYRIISEYGGTPAPRNTLNKCLRHIQTTSENSTLSLYEKAQAYYRTFIEFLPFGEQSVLIGLVSISVFLQHNGCNIVATAKDIYTCHKTLISEKNADAFTLWYESMFSMPQKKKSA